MSVLSKVLRVGEGKKVRRLAEIVPLINALEPEMEALSDAELRAKTVEFRQRIAQGETLDDLLVEAYAVVREAGWRVLGQRHFDVQLMGGMALHFGWIAEMKTGEGKTLVSTLPAYLNALGGEGVHMVTSNDYLATRDATWMGRLHGWLGLTVGRVGPDITDVDAKRAAYQCDITYGTNTELGFDYLKDNMAMSREFMVQRGHPFAIIDEVDSILIDEARTPLIISGPSSETAQLYTQFASIARTLKRDVDYEVDEEKRTVHPTEEGIAKVERAVGVENIYDAVTTSYVHQLSKALEAKELWQRDKHYLVAGGEVHIVDEFTGRTLEGRRWADGLHQAVEAKERVKIKDENHTWATVTLQNYFKLYAKISGMTGTAETEAGEFASTYDLPVVPIPTNKVPLRIDEPDLIFKTEAAKFDAVINDIVEANAKGQPVLVGTASVAKSELLSSLLQRRGIAHEVLNAKQHFREAEIVAQAGRLGAVTVATNMAGRGVDILLGGNPELLAQREAVAQKLDLTTDEGQAALAELTARFKIQCDAEADQVRAAGGLYVLGSERHESRRIDNQLRGRAGRQGDPGASRFFLSLEDDLMRLFATGALSWVMGRTLPDDQPIEAKMVTRAIEKAQNTVEGKNAEQRKELLKYDAVMNEQRKVIYQMRLDKMDGEDLSGLIQELIDETMTGIVTDCCPGDYPEAWELPRLLVELTQYYPTQFSVEDLSQASSQAQVLESVLEEAHGYYLQHSSAYPGGEEQARTVERELMLQIIDQRWRDHLAEMDYLREGIHLRGISGSDPVVAWQREGFAMFGELISAINDEFLRYVLHVDHGGEMPVATELDLAKAVYQAADESDLDVSNLAMRMAPDVGQAVAGIDGASPTFDAEGAQSFQPVVKSAEERIGRNDPCYCGSGKKFKFCHGAAG